MRVTVCELHGIDLRRIYFWKFNLSFRGNAYQLYSSPKGEFLQARSQSIIDDYCISIKSGSSNTCIKLSPAFFHSSDDIYNRCWLNIFKLVQHLSNGQIILVNVIDLDKLSEFASRKEKIVWLPELLLHNWFPLTDLWHRQFLLILRLIFLLLFHFAIFWCLLLPLIPFLFLFLFWLLILRLFLSRLLLLLITAIIHYVTYYYPERELLYFYARTTKCTQLPNLAASLLTIDRRCVK